MSRIVPEINLKTDSSHQDGEAPLDSNRSDRRDPVFPDPKPVLKKKQTTVDYLMAIFLHKEEISKDGIFEDGKVTKYYFYRMMYTDVAATIISTMGLIISVLQYDLEYLEPTGWINNYLAWVIFISTLVLVFFTHVRYLMELQLMKEQKIVDRKKSLWSSHLFKYYLLEMAIIAPCPLPFVIDLSFRVSDFKTEILLDWDINFILSLYILLRVLIIGRFFLNLTSYCNYRACRIGRMYGVDTGYLYAIRCMMKNSPAIFLSVLFFWIVVIFGHALRICEREFQKNPSDLIRLGYYYNAFWTIIVTMTTVGYGDYFPRTVPGRFIVFLVCILGIFVVSSIVVALGNYLDLNPMERKVLNVIMRLQKRLEVRNEAAFVLTIMWKILFLMKDGGMDTELKRKKNNELQESLKDHIKTFKTNNRQLRDMFEGFSVTENLNNSFGFVKMKFYDLFDKQEKLNQLNERIASSLGVNLNRL